MKNIRDRCQCQAEQNAAGEFGQGRTLAFAGRWADGDTVSFHAMNRNKEAVVADLKDPGDPNLEINVYVQPK